MTTSMPFPPRSETMLDLFHAVSQYLAIHFHGESKEEEQGQLSVTNKKANKTQEGFPQLSGS